MRRHLLSLSLLVVASACADGVRPGLPGARPAADPAAAGLIRVRTVAGGRAQIVALPLEEYVLASVLSEVTPPRGAPAAERIFEIQAIVARTYAVANRGRHADQGYDLCATTHCQIVDLDRPRTSRWSTVARQAVDRTRGRVLYYGGRLASTLYHADCGGVRADAADVWGSQPVPYLRGGADPLPGGLEHSSWRFVADRDTLQAALDAHPATAVGGRLDTVDVQQRDSSGRARLVLLNGARAPVVRGEDLRAAVAAAFGPASLRSALFDVRREGNRFVFEGRGYGHGVGLCQKGAFARAAAGEPVGRILAFYYPGTQLR